MVLGKHRNAAWQVCCILVISLAWLVGCDLGGDRLIDMEVDNRTACEIRLILNGRPQPGTYPPHTKRAFHGKRTFLSTDITVEARRGNDNSRVFQRDYEGDEIREARRQNLFTVVIEDQTKERTREKPQREASQP